MKIISVHSGPTYIHVTQKDRITNILHRMDPNITIELSGGIHHQVLILTIPMKLVINEDNQIDYNVIFKLGMLVQSCII